MPLEPEPYTENAPSTPSDPPGPPELQETPEAPKLQTSKSKAKMEEVD
jgi:hypothetical protein